ncbi:hypothetical protein JX265_006253 [Neoarthrinium moseri]|uniref:CCCH zinc finger protein n=1 Tax=Neoarthrinium moseri TaxID=1658444 RepID=A0A9Q0AP82_9PEZI|nr:uncharacterized protein JN550_011988 [Neoarthrinium moseri]KAI1841704.1 hypothetical protein JX266_012072 [Neoarthrinium moseri]KAI1859580.1 hypothetical protein JN550_011988 [Neoarthrinium moseri]KAI1870083.1 hypothetical protein JX265_006253 [Neoarthrinium moseri]
MSTAEEQELLAQISRLEGRINRHKAAQQGPRHSDPPAPHYPSRGSYRTAPYPRGGYRGHRAHAPTYRNKTLVLNGQSRPTTGGDSAASSDSNSSWVTRTDRHLQLINTMVFEKDTQARASAIEQTQRQKRLKKEQMEKARFLSFVQKNGDNVPSAPSNSVAAASKYEITVDGIRFQVTRQGSKLVRVPGDTNVSSTTPRVASVGGVKFYRTKNGNLVRHGIAKAQRMAGGIKKVDVPCKAFSWTGIVFSITSLRNRLFYQRLDGVVLATKGRNAASYMTLPRWPYVVTGCSRTIAPMATPVTSHTSQLKSGRPFACTLPMANATTNPVHFGLYGYCERGAKCPDRHVFECPDFSNTGVCKTEGCKLLHRERASLLRSKAGTDQEMADLSSDEEDGAPDDIDSDEVEEFIGNEDAESLDFSKDYIGF